MTSKQKTLKIRLVIPVCDRVYEGYYCSDAEYPDERLNLLAKAFEIEFKKEKDSNLYPNLVITSNNFLFFPVDKEDVLKSYLKVFLKGLKPEKDTHLLLGVDSRVENPYRGISAAVFHFFRENKEWKYKQHIWECWNSCKKECCKDQSDRYMEELDLVFLSCGDILKSCCNKRNWIENKKIIVDLSHMDFCPGCFKNKKRNENFARTLLETVHNSYLVVTTQISRDQLFQSTKNFFRIEKGLYKLLYQNSSSSSEEDPLRKLEELILSSQTIIALDKQSTDYEIIEDWNNPNSFKDERKLKQVDAFFIDFEIPLNENTETGETNQDN